MDVRVLEQLMTELAERGFSVVEGLLPEALLGALSERLDELREGEALRPALIGRGQERQRQRQIRGDSIHWLPPPPLHDLHISPSAPLSALPLKAQRRSLSAAPPLGAQLSAAERQLYQEIDALVTQLNRSFFMGVKRYEFHYACYEAGAGYERHSDRFKGSDERVISLVFYLNPSWLPGDGGELKLYLPEELDGGTLDPLTGERSLLVAPLWGYTVCFESARFEHEVLAAHTERRSVTGWLRR